MKDLSNLHRVNPNIRELVSPEEAKSVVTSCAKKVGSMTQITSW